MDIPANSPLQVEAVEAKTFDKWVVDRLQFSGDGVTQPLSGEAFFKLGRKNEDGSIDEDADEEVDAESDSE